MDKSKLGLIHIYTGDGKGKTTAALGLIWEKYFTWIKANWA